jgi:hypothetical protein
MHDSPEVDGRDGRPARSSGLTFVGLLVGAVMVTILLGQLTSPDPPPGPPKAVATGAPRPSATPAPDTPIGVDSIRQCMVRMGGLTLGDHLSVPGSALERWDCDGPPGGPWSVVIRAAGGHFGVHGAVVTFPVDLVGSGVPSTKPADGVWNPGAQTLVWPLGSSYAQIVGDLGQSTLEDLATATTVTDGRPHFAAPAGFAIEVTIPYRSPVVHEMRYGAVDLGQMGTLGDSLVFTGVTWAASFETLAFESHATPAGLVRGKPAIYSGALGGSGTLAWESAPGEVTYIGYEGPESSARAMEALRALADKGRMLTPEQWATKDRFPVAAPSG